MDRIPIVPRTPLRIYYETFGDEHSSFAARLAEAKRLLAAPDELSRRVQDSQKQTQGFDRRDIPFHDRRVDWCLPDAGQRSRATRPMVRWLISQGENGVPATTPTVAGFRVIDWEVPPLRCTNGVWEGPDSRPARSSGRTCMDYLGLSNEASPVPIVGEIKVGADKDVFFALVQGLMYATEIATPNQIDRLDRHHLEPLRRAARRGETWCPPVVQLDPPQVDVHLLEVDRNPRSAASAMEPIVEQLARRLMNLLTATNPISPVRSITRMSAAVIPAPEDSSPLTVKWRHALGRGPE